MKALEAKVDASFGDGYFFASHEVAQALPHPFNLQATFGWDQEQIMAKVA